MAGLVGMALRLYKTFYPTEVPKQASPRPLRFGILGAAAIGPLGLIIPARTHPEVVVHAVAARNLARAQEYAQKHGIAKAYEGYQALLDDPEVDVVYNALPNALHYEWTMKALEAGKHVLNEKPSADTAEETRAMFNYAAERGLVLLDAYHFRFHPALKRAKAIVDSGELGELKHITVKMQVPEGYFPEGDIRYDYSLGGGTLMDMGCYAVNSVRYFASCEPTAVVATQHKVYEPKNAPVDYVRNVDTRMEATFTLERAGATAQIVIDAGLPPVLGVVPAFPDTRVVVECELGRVEMLNHIVPTYYHYIEVTPRGGHGRTEKVYTGDGKGEAWWLSWRHQLEALVDKVRGREPETWLTGGDSVQTMVWIEKVYEKVRCSICAYVNKLRRAERTGQPAAECVFQKVVSRSRGVMSSVLYKSEHVSLSPPMSSLNRRLSARRGSTTAPDPFGVHADVNLNPNRSSSSTLTIVRVPAPAPAPVPAANDPPASPVLGTRRLHRRLPRDAPGGPAPVDPPAARLSFAFSSFGPAGGPRAASPSRSHPPSPSSSPRLRPSSPHLGPSFPTSGKPRLTPDQLVDLARQATNPRAPIPSPNDFSASPATLPATFTPLPDDIFLPFIDRPSEVAALISSPPDVKLFTLLAQTFPKAQTPPNPVAAVAQAEQEGSADLPRDPANWTYPELVYHLTKIDRDVAPDFIWTIAARKCIISHSELIWERIKGALGVPPELDVEYDFLDDDQESPDTSDISDDEGRAAKGHWSDWDEVMDSPVYARNPKRFSLESPSASIYFSGRRLEDHDTKFREQIDDRLQDLQDTGYAPSSTAAPGGSGAATIVPTPHDARSPEEHSGIIVGAFSPPLITQREPTLEEGVDYVSIKPLIAPSPTPSNSFASGGGADGLGDIAEGAEEEEESADSTAAAAASTSPQSHLSVSSTHDGMISPSQIQGLRISTSPVPTAPPNAVLATPPVLSPLTSLPPLAQPSGSPSHTAAGTHPQTIPSSGASAGAYTGSRSHSRTSSFSSIGPFQRSESTGNLAASWHAMAVAAAGGIAGEGGSGSQYGGSVFGSEAGDSSGYISDGDRGAGHPLFPSNFARLTGGPTMRANNPSTRSSAGHIPHARYRAATKGRGGAPPAGVVNSMPRARRLSWGAGSVPLTSTSSTTT